MGAGLGLVMAGCGRVRIDETVGPIDAASENDGGSLDAGSLDASLDVGLLDAGSLDAGSLDAGACWTPTAFACLDFETDPPAPWTSVVNDGLTLSYDVDASFRGRALHYRAPVAPMGTPFDGGLLLPVDAAQFEAGLYVSAWARIERVTDTGYVVLIEGSNAGAADHRKLSLDQTPNEVMMAVSTAGTPSGIATGTRALRNSTWVCLEYWASTEGGFPALEVTADGVVTQVVADGTYEGFRQLAIGISVESDAVDVWFDDVTVATSRVGCRPTH